MSIVSSRPVTVAVLLAAGFAIHSASAVTYALTGGGDSPVRMSNTAAWHSGNFPVSDASSTVLRIFGYDRTIVNDLGADFNILRLTFTKGAKSSVMKGDAFNVYGDTRAISTSATEGSESLLSVTQRIETVVNFYAAGANIEAVEPTDELYFAAPLVHLAQTLGDRRWSFNGDGVKTIAGGICIDEADVTTWEKRTGFTKGTIVVASDVYIPFVSLSGGARLVIRDGARMNCWCDVGKYTASGSFARTYSFFQSGTFDIEDGVFACDGRVSFGQAADSELVVNVYEKGVLDSGVNGLRLGNNGYATINMRGGRFFYRQVGDLNFSEHGATHLNLFSGLVTVIDSASVCARMPIHSTSTKAPIAWNNRINLAGGELVCGGFANKTPSGQRAAEPIDLFFDGGILRCGASDDMFVFGNAGTAAQIVARVRSGGFKIDTRDNDVVWNDVTLQGTDETDVSDGGLEKTGSGTFTLSAAAEYSGLTKIVGGRFHVSDSAFFSGDVELRPRTTLSFDGESLTLASLASADGIVVLGEGQSLALGAAPAIDGMLVFDVDASTEGSRTLLTAPDLTADIAAACAVKNPAAGKACSFAVDGDALVLTVSGGVAPSVPVLAESEDPELIVSGSGTTVWESADEDGRTLAFDGGNLEYTGADALSLDTEDYLLRKSSTMTLAPGSGDVTLVGPPDIHLLPSAKTMSLTLNTAADNAFRFTGDWSGYAYPWMSPWSDLVLASGNFVFGPQLTEDFVSELSFNNGVSFTVKDTSIRFPDMTPQSSYNPERPDDAAILVLDGATVKVRDDGVSSDDFFSGVTSLALGAGGVEIDTGTNDVTVLQTLAPTGLVETAGLTKSGSGSLTLAGRHNWICGPLSVSGGLLRAAFDTGVHRAYPEGAMALWTFDGADPYSDKTGHGYDLVQAHEGDAAYDDVTFREENAMTGKAAFFSESKKGSLKATNILSTSFIRQSVSAWVRLKDGKRSRGNANIISTRVKDDFSSTGHSFDLAYKWVTKTNDVTLTGNNLGFGTVWANAQATIWNDVVGKAPTVGEWHHLVMVNDNGIYSSYLDGVCYVDRIKGGITEFLSSGYLITIGQGTQNGEFMEPGGMVDEVAIYPRALSAAEVGQIYSGASADATFPVTVAAGATWDMNGATSMVTTVTGDGAVTNGQLVVTSGIYPGSARALYLSEPCFDGTEGTVSFGFADDERPPVETPFVLFTFDEMSEESEANLVRWTAVGLGLRAESNRGRITVDRDAGVVYGVIEPEGFMMIVR